MGGDGDVAEEDGVAIYACLDDTERQETKRARRGGRRGRRVGRARHCTGDTVGIQDDTGATASHVAYRQMPIPPRHFYYPFVKLLLYILLVYC